jgi:pilus assembly protein CpaC
LIPRGDQADDGLSVPLYKSRIVQLNTPISRVSIGNPDIADIVILRASQMYVLGKDLGTTNVLLWDRNDRLINSISVEVTHDLEGLRAKLHALLPAETILVYSAHRSIILSGEVTSLVAAGAAVQIAENYLAQAATATEKQMFEEEAAQGGVGEGEVVNLLTVGGGQQVMLSVVVAEMARTELRKLDVRFFAVGDSGNWRFGGVNGGGTFPDGIGPPLADGFLPNDLTIDDKGFFAGFMSSDFLFQMAFSAAKEKGLAKILAEPTLTTLSGQEATFLSGGEFPIPVPGGNDNSTTIEFKDFGVGLAFLPVVLGSDHINLSLNVSVSELSSQNALVLDDSEVSSSFFVPSLTKRSVSTTVELADGETIGIAGLLSENVREVVKKFPLLGSLPILGALFRSQEYIEGETELVILVTPRLAKPIDPESIRLPTDKFVRPNDWEFYMLGKTEGSPERVRERSSLSTDTGGTTGNFGHVLAE